MKTEGERPPRFCNLHPIGTSEECGGCARAREHLEAWDEHAAQSDVIAAKAHDFERRRNRQLIENCPMHCAENSGMVEVLDDDGTERLKRCDHGVPRGVASNA
ncbi:hypothetical protein CG716_01830 [Mycolicibacterium sphagni]|uniref:Uncharacterized protein n=1 Tax=Mycolicibacterium sphagni TaxID=1786 RepID=A0A255DW51_9MYCO|nr:hypothetical protein CG716_01830 [Mycolicibacterium sphagni]